MQRPALLASLVLTLGNSAAIAQTPNERVTQAINAIDLTLGKIEGLTPAGKGAFTCSTAPELSALHQTKKQQAKQLADARLEITRTEQAQTQTALSFLSREKTRIAARIKFIEEKGLASAKSSLEAAQADLRLAETADTQILRDRAKEAVANHTQQLQLLEQELAKGKLIEALTLKQEAAYYQKKRMETSYEELWKQILQFEDMDSDLQVLLIEQACPKPPPPVLKHRTRNGN